MLYRFMGVRQMNRIVCLLISFHAEYLYHPKQSPKLSLCRQSLPSQTLQPWTCFLPFNLAVFQNVMWKESYIMYLFGSGFFHFTKTFKRHPGYCMNNWFVSFNKREMLMCGCTTDCLCIHRLKDIWVVSSVWYYG